MSPILKTLRGALASSICAVFLSSAVSPTTSVATNNSNVPSAKEVVVVPATKAEAVAPLEAKQVILRYSYDCYNVYAVGGYIRYCEGRSPEYFPYDNSGDTGSDGPTTHPGGTYPVPDPNGDPNPPCNPYMQDCPPPTVLD